MIELHPEILSKELIGHCFDAPRLGTEPAAFAGKGEEVFVLTIIAADPGEAAFEDAAVDEFLHDLLNHRAKGSVPGLVGVGVAAHEGGLAPLGALPKG